MAWTRWMSYCVTRVMDTPFLPVEEEHGMKVKQCEETVSIHPGIELVSTVPALAVRPTLWMYVFGRPGVL